MTKDNPHDSGEQDTDTEREKDVFDYLIADEDVAQNLRDSVERGDIEVEVGDAE